MIEFFVFRFTDGEIVKRIGVGDGPQLLANIPEGCGYIVATMPGVPDETHKVDTATLQLVEK